MKKIVVSLTSFPSRINIVSEVIENMFSQTMKPDVVMLSLSSFEFPNKIKELPNKLVELTSKGLKIRWCDGDLKCHKKYFFAMQEYPDDIIITVDDDMIYDLSLIEKLYKSYQKFPNAVSSARAHLMLFDENGNLSKYNDWIRDCKKLVDTPTHRLFVTSVGGVLYPPKCISKEAYDIDAIMKFASTQDDIWLKIMQLINNTPVVAVPTKPSKIIIRAQTKRLASVNVQNGKNDMFLRDCFNEYNYYHGEEDTLIARMKNDSFLKGSEHLLIEQELCSQINKYKNSLSSKIVKKILFMPKKIVSYFTK